ncbi:hypothetical protein KL953_31400 [Mycolicibacterium goodii]|uniref:hypothetical protein n=1 Tax=Mycolicibacterium goodii TaxID=134601 RepID=UPI001BDD0B9B|nr:hypothetical protein [Mycolicibacterium goodii]MBU8813384.1 hypothetical protein [Mycolicibacterium goodii]
MGEEEVAVGADGVVAATFAAVQEARSGLAIATKVERQLLGVSILALHHLAGLKEEVAVGADGVVAATFAAVQEARSRLAIATKVERQLLGVSILALHHLAGLSAARRDATRPRSCHRLGPLDLPFKSKRYRHGSVAVPMVSRGGFIAVGSSQQRA